MNTAQQGQTLRDRRYPEYFYSDTVSLVNMEAYLHEIRATANPSEADWSVRGSNRAQAMAQSVKSVPGKSKELSSSLKTHKKKNARGGIKLFSLWLLVSSYVKNHNSAVLRWGLVVNLWLIQWQTDGLLRCHLLFRRRHSDPPAGSHHEHRLGSTHPAGARLQLWTPDMWSCI